MRKTPENITKDLLVKLYIEENRSYSEISKVINKSLRQIGRYLQKFGIEPRPFSTKGLRAWNRGIPMRSESREKLRKFHLGKKIPLEVRKKMGRKGNKNHAWIDGRTSVNKILRHSVEYKEWHNKVFKRDDWTCQFCGKRGGELHADHIAPFSKYPELRFSVDNGRTLCPKCHRIRHKSERNKLKL